MSWTRRLAFIPIGIYISSGFVFVVAERSATVRYPWYVDHLLLTVVWFAIVECALLRIRLGDLPPLILGLLSGALIGPLYWNGGSTQFVRDLITFPSGFLKVVALGADQVMLCALVPACLLIVYLGRQATWPLRFGSRLSLIIAVVAFLPLRPSWFSGLLEVNSVCTLLMVLGVYLRIRGERAMNWRSICYAVFAVIVIRREWLLLLPLGVWYVITIWAGSRLAPGVLL